MKCSLVQPIMISLWKCYTTNLHMRLFCLTPSLIGSINARIPILTNRQIVFIGLSACMFYLIESSRFPLVPLLVIRTKAWAQLLHLNSNRYLMLIVRFTSWKMLDTHATWNNQGYFIRLCLHLLRKCLEHSSEFRWNHNHQDIKRQDISWLCDLLSL